MQKIRSDLAHGAAKQGRLVKAFLLIAVAYVLVMVIWGNVFC